VADTMKDEDAYPAELESHLSLDGGWCVRIRALHACEGEPIRALYRRLSDTSRYLRFLSPMPTLPDAVVRALACVDHRRSVALVAEDARADAEGRVIGLAGFSAVEAGAAEVAVVVRADGAPWTIAPALRAARIASRRRLLRIPVNARCTPSSVRRTPAFSGRGGVRRAAIISSALS